MAEFDLDLESIEQDIEPSDEGRVVLGVLDGTTDPGEWIESVARGHVLVLSIEGELTELASGFAQEVKDGGGQLVHFRDFLIVSPDGINVDTDRLN